MYNNLISLYINTSISIHRHTFLWLWLLLFGFVQLFFSIWMGGVCCVCVYLRIVVKVSSCLLCNDFHWNAGHTVFLVASEMNKFVKRKTLRSLITSMEEWTVRDLLKYFLSLCVFVCELFNLYYKSIPVFIILFLYKCLL